MILAAVLRTDVAPDIWPAGDVRYDYIGRFVMPAVGVGSAILIIAFAVAAMVPANRSMRLRGLGMALVFVFEATGALELDYGYLIIGFGILLVLGQLMQKDKI